MGENADVLGSAGGDVTSLAPVTSGTDNDLSTQRITQIHTKNQQLQEDGPPLAEGLAEMPYRNHQVASGAAIDMSK